MLGDPHRAGPRCCLLGEQAGLGHSCRQRARHPLREFAAIERFVQDEMAAQRIPGLALGIVEDDRITYLRGFGKADDSGRPVTPRTPFIIGSLSKSFTALAIMQLVEAGKVDLDAPVQRYLPWFRVADEDASARDHRPPSPEPDERPVDEDRADVPGQRRHRVTLRSKGRFAS